MSKFRRVLFILCGLAIISQSLWLWDATERRYFTQYYRPDLDPANMPADPLDATLQAAGIYDAGGRPDPIDFRFHFGLLPSGFGKQLFSVCSLGGFGLLVAVAGIWPSRTRAATAHHGTAQRIEGPTS